MWSQSVVVNVAETCGRERLRARLELRPKGGTGCEQRGGVMKASRSWQARQSDALGARIAVDPRRPDYGFNALLVPP